ncbi:MAG: FHA domain-containing protein [Clostridia bacterium]|nr:FHA domain-containing protein [Clostridia bacterium]
MEKTVFKVETSAEAAWLNVEIENYVDLDTIAIQVVAQDCPDFLLPIHVAEKNGICTLRYRLITGTALEYSLRRNMSKAGFLEFALKLMTPFVKCKNWFLDYHNLCIDTRYILFDKAADQYVFVYVPLVGSGNSDKDIIRFFEKVFTNIDIPDDQTYQISLSRYFRDNQVQLDSLRKMLLFEKNKLFNDEFESKEQPVMAPQISIDNKKVDMGMISAAPDVPPLTRQSDLEEDLVPYKPEKNSGSRVGFMERIKGKNKKQSVSTPMGVDFEAIDDFSLDVNGMVGKKQKMPSEKKVKNKNNPEPPKPLVDPVKIEGKKEELVKSIPAVRNVGIQTVSSETLGGAEDLAEDYTNVVDASFASERKYLELLDTVTTEMPPKMISLEFKKEYITLGRSSSNGNNSELDIVFPQRSGVSRMHLRIARQGGKLVVIDLGSTNYTLLDDQRLVPNIEYDLQDGMVLTLAERRPIRYRVHC